MEVSLNITYRGDKLRSVREERGLSQSQLAARAGLSVRMLQDYEQGKRDFNGAKLKTILRICIALECKLEDVINEPETMDLLRQYGE
ncbi:MAG: helix-turn-helix transcriptional regulator [Clostridia bacterium]|nr:helix-turn-helix transcriptional regulator [Clostridia bacterium]